MEVFKAFEPSVDEVVGSNGVKVIHISSEGVEDLCSKFRRKWGDFQTISCYFQYIFIIHQCFLGEF